MGAPFRGWELSSVGKTATSIANLQTSHDRIERVGRARFIKSDKSCPLPSSMLSAGLQPLTCQGPLGEGMVSVMPAWAFGGRRPCLVVPLLCMLSADRR